MFTEQQRQRFRALRQSEIDGTLTPSEQTELQLLTQQVEAAEAAYLRPTTERMRQERLDIEAQNASLQALLQRRERLARRLERVLALSMAEREKINTQLAAILGAASAGANR